MKEFCTNKPLSFSLFTIAALILVFIVHLILESCNKERKGCRKNYKALGFEKARYKYLRIYYNVDTAEMMGRNAFSEILIDIFVWIDVNIFFCKGFHIIIEREIENNI